MSTSVMQVRVDDDLRAKAAAVYDELGIKKSDCQQSSYLERLAL